MKIRSNAWHYKFYEIGHSGCGPSRTNLCSYFWRTLSGMGLVTLLSILILGIIGILGFVSYNEPVAISIILVAVGAGIGLIRLGKYAKNNYQAPEPGLLRLYLKARKDKICPLVEIV